MYTSYEFAVGAQGRQVDELGTEAAADNATLRHINFGPAGHIEVHCTVPWPKLERGSTVCVELFVGWKPVR